MSLDDIIEFDNENTNLDFKKEEYKKERYESLIKDIMSMANAINLENKRIVIGVKDRPGGKKEFIGIEKPSDQAIFESIIQDNVEPSINFRYFSYDFKGTKLGIFEIFNNNDKPYMMKKDYGALKKGDMWIRKGSRQSKVTREDLNRMREFSKETVFDNRIKIGFGKELSNSMSISKCFIDKSKLPSSKRKKELEELIDKLDRRYFPNDERVEVIGLKKFTALKQTRLNLFGEFHDTNKSIRAGYNSLGFPVYQNREELLESIDGVVNDYFDEDNYFVFEENANKFNCQIYNDSTEFLEQVKIELYFDAEIFSIPDKIYDDPSKQSLLIKSHKNFVEDGYPNVYLDGDFIIAEEYHTQVRHKTLTNIFFEDLRVLIKPTFDLEEAKVKYRIGAKNLPNPVVGFIILKVM